MSRPRWRTSAPGRASSRWLLLLRPVRLLRDPAELPAASPSAGAHRAARGAMDAADWAAIGRGRREPGPRPPRLARVQELTARFDACCTGWSRSAAKRAAPCCAPRSGAASPSQNLQDEVNQALTASCCAWKPPSRPPDRLQAELRETRGSSTTHGGAAPPRAPAAADRARRHGLLPRSRAGVRLRPAHRHRDAVRAGALPPPSRMSSSSWSIASRRRALENRPPCRRAPSGSPPLLRGAHDAPVSDDGRGFAPRVDGTAAAGRPGGLGLSGMRERAMLAAAILGLHPAGPRNDDRVDPRVSIRSSRRRPGIVRGGMRLLLSASRTSRCRGGRRRPRRRERALATRPDLCVLDVSMHG